MVQDNMTAPLLMNALKCSLPIYAKKVKPALNCMHGKCMICCPCRTTNCTDAWMYVHSLLHIISRPAKFVHVHLLIYICIIIKVHAFRGMVYMDTMQSAADSKQALFPCNYTGYYSNKGQVLASVYYHYILLSFTIHMI